MAVYEVQAPDGGVYEVEGPDNATPEQLAQAFQGQQLPPVEPPKGLPREVTLPASALARGAASLPAAGADAMNALQQKAPGGPAIMQAFPPLRALSGAMQAGSDLVTGKGEPVANPMAAMQAVQGFGTQPETTKEKYLSSTLEGAAGGVAGPGGFLRPIISALAGAGGGAAAEAGSQLSNNNPLVRALMGVLGGGATGLAAAKVANIAPQTSTVAREMMQGADGDALSAAQIYMQQQAQQGRRIDLAQALEATGGQSGNVRHTRDVLANSRHGDRVQAVLREQPAELERAANTAIGNVRGPNVSSGEAANAVQSAATGAINAVKRGRTNAVRADYAAAGNLPESARNQLASILESQLSQPGTTDTTRRAANEILGRIRPQLSEADVNLARQAVGEATSPGARATARQQLAQALAENEVRASRPLHALDADTALSDAMGAYKGTPLTPADPKSAGQLRHLGRSVNEALQEASPAIRTAEARYAQISRDTVDPLKQSIVGQVATPRGARPDIQASAAKLESLFAKGADTGVPSNRRDVAVLSEHLRTIDPDAVPGAVKAFLRNRLDNAFVGAERGGASQSVDAAKKLYDTLFATRAQREGLRDMGAAVARSYQMPEADVVNGLENLATLTKAMANRPSSVGGMNPQELKELAGSSALANSMRVFGFLPFEKAARGLESATMGRTYRDLDALLTTPEGVDTLRRLGQVPVMSAEAAGVLGGFFGGGAATVQRPKER